VAARFFEALKLNDATNYWRRGRVPSGSYLPQLGNPNTTTKWFPSDTQAEYKKNGNKSFGPDEITYTFNEHGYRSRSFITETSAKKVLMLGCSCTMGIGLNAEDCWPSITARLLSEHYGVAFEDFNLGYGAHGLDYSVMVASQVIPVIKPDLILVLIPDLTRRVMFSQFNVRHPMGLHWGTNTLHRYFVSLQSDAQDFYEFVKNIQFLENLSKANSIPLLWEVTHIDFLPEEDVLFEYVDASFRTVARFDDYMISKDFARDNMHPGKKTHMQYAKQLVADILARKLVKGL
jgi:hypothetical protein